MLSAIQRRLQKYYLARRPKKYHAAEQDGLIYAMEYLAAKESERYRDPLRLLQYGFKVFSQNDEDGMLEEVFRRIGVTGRRFVEFGVGNGSENNTLNLLLSDWTGVWIEANPKNQDSIHLGLAEQIAAGRLKVLDSMVTRENINTLVEQAGVHGDLDLMSIDLDGNDYWVWESIAAIKPRVVVIEYNATLRPPHRLVMRYNPAHSWDGSNYFGASLKAIEALGDRKGYCLVGCSLSGSNAFFVRRELVGDRFLAPFTAENHYEPARYGRIPAGHPARIGPYEKV